MTTTDSLPDKGTRRRAVRAAGPASSGEAETTTVRVKKAEGKAREVPSRPRKSRPTRRRAGHERLVGVVALTFVIFAVLAMGGVFTWLLVAQNHERHAQARNERFVDAAKQTLVNMYTFKQDTLEQDVDRFYNSMSGPLRDEWGRDNHIANLKALLRSTGNSSEAVVNGAALETRIDPVSNNADVLVALRVTQADNNGNNKPSQPMRWRVTVHEDFDTGQLTAFDMKYPDGGN